MQVNWEAHPTQSRILKRDERFIVVPMGRRAGKTEAAMVWLLMEGRRLLDEGHDPEAIKLVWASPQWNQCERGLEKVVKPTKEDGSPNPLHAAYEDHVGSAGHMSLTTKWGFEIKFTTTKNRERIEGEGIHALVIDEAGLVPEGAWYNSLYPTLAMTEGRAFITGRPRGRSWYYDLFTKAQDPHEPDYWGIQAPSHCNPHLPDSFIEQAKKDLPERAYRQEIEAEFLDDSGGVFNNVRSLVTTSSEFDGPPESEGRGFEEPQDGKRYVAGWDPAKSQDYSVLTILALPERHVVHVDRSQSQDYNQQVENVVSTLEKYNDATLLMDSNGVGDPLFDFTREAFDGVVESYKFTNSSKADLINQLSLLIDQQDISWPEHPVLTNELEVFEQDTTRSGNIRYHAPEGHHDDMVDSLALAAWQSMQTPEQKEFFNLGSL